jgi:integrase
MTRQTSNGHHISWQALEGKVAPEVLSAPKTGSDPPGDWLAVHGRVVHYLLNNVVGKSWADHLTLIAAVLSARRRDVHTVYLRVRGLNARFSALFPLLGLKQMEEWNVDIHLPMYLKGEISSRDSQITRYTFLKDYSSATMHVWNWYDALPEAEQEVYRRFVLPPVNPLQIEGLNKRNEIVEQQQLHRKTETAAVVPHFSALRAEAHFRYNRLARLRQAYYQALERVLPDRSNLPLDFFYEEGSPPVERFHFKLWDRRSFVLDPEHANLYHPSTYECAKYGLQAFSAEQNAMFLEFIKSEQLEGDTPPEGFWFTELLTLGLLGMGARRGSDQQVAARQAWLRQWGYGEGTPEERVAPFKTDTPGLLSWGDGKSNRGGGTGQFIKNAQRRTKGTLIPVESLYAAATFGLLALDLLTTTGMRCGELMQVNLLPKCIVRLVDDPPAGAKDRSPRVRYLLRLLPKGERTETLHNYGVGKESMRLIERTAHMLCEHYKLQPGETLPCVAFDPGHSRSHRFEQEKVPYLFQYNHQHLSDSSITACLRFLIHGMVFQTSEGQSVVIKPHLLRHAFATFAVHVEGLPIDLVAKWLQQKNLEVTGYYSEMPEYMQVEQHASFVARLATQINIREAILRSPEEIRKQAEAARKRVGMLVPVCGGDCTLDAYCPNQFDCIHCPAKAPDPEKRYQVEEKRRWGKERLAYYEREGLVLEAEKMRQLIRACDLELREMEQIVAYRKDETRVIQIQPRPKRPS